MHLLNSVLYDRTLWYDGDSVFESPKLCELLTKYDIEYVTELTSAVNEYNKYVGVSNSLKLKKECNESDDWYTWNIPEYYKTLDVIDYVADKHIDLTKEMSDSEVIAREKRLSVELHSYKTYNLIDILRTMIYIVETLKTHNIVYGVGRGSSTASYVLYIIGTHDVDSFLYDLNINDFFHV